MNRRETAEEPSMEDILASIRKIIADEPAASTTPALPLPQASPAGFASAPPAKEPHAQFGGPQPSLTARLNDVFGAGSGMTADTFPAAKFPAKPFPSRPLRSVMDDDLGDMLADAPLAPAKAAEVPAAVTKPAPTVIAAPPAGSRPFPLDRAATDLLAGRTAIPAPPSPPAGDSTRPQPQSGFYPPNARLTELRSSPPLHAPASFDTSPSFPPQAAQQPAAQQDAPRPAPVVIASMAPMEQRPLPAARPFNFAPGAPAAAQHAAPSTVEQAAPAAASLAVQSPALRPEPVVIASSQPFTAPIAPPSSPLQQPSIAATLAPAAPEIPAKPAGISAATLDFLMPSARQTDPVPPAPAQRDSLPVAPIISASTLDFLKPVPRAVEGSTEEVAAQTAPAAAAQPAPEPAPPAQAPVVVAAPPPEPTPVAPFIIAAAPERLEPEPTPAAATIAAATDPNGEATADPSDAVASALGALAAGLAASSRGHAPEIVVSAVEISPPKPEAKSEAEPVQLQDKLAATASMVSAAGVSVFSAPATVAGNSELKAISTSTLDDTAAELLRPMLRQWLDDNMPRIVERALRIELTQAVTITDNTAPEK